MLINLEPIEISLEDASDREFASWYDENKQMTKHITKLGYYVVRDGVEGFVRQENVCMEKEIEVLKKRHTEEIANERAKHARIMKESSLVFDETMKQLKDSMSVADIKSLIEQEYTAKMAIATLQAEQETEKRYVKEVTELKDALNKYKWLCEEMQTKYDSVQKRIVNVEQEYKDKMENDYDAKMSLAVLQAQQDLERKFADQLVGLRTEADKFKALYDDVKCKYEYEFAKVIQNQKDKEIEGLRQKLEDNEKELCILKKTNFAKGNKGENLIMTFLRQYFPQYEYVDASKDKHCGDIHMLGQESHELIMIESKYKEYITKQDVDKFFNDIEHLQAINKNITCGVFVSVLTKNIPHIGEVKIDFCKGVPVIFVGFAGEEEFQEWFKQYIILAKELSQYHQKSNVGEQHIQDVLRQISPFLDQIKSIKNTVDKLRHTHLLHVNNSVVELENSVKKLFDGMCDILASSGLTTNKQCYDDIMCPICSLAFANKRALGSHMRIHKDKN
jgi:hypothetical protein